MSIVIKEKQDNQFNINFNKYMRYKLLLIALILPFCGNLAAQSNFDNTVQKGIIYDKEFTLDFKIHTNGYFSLGANIATIKAYNKTQFYHFEIGNLKHSRESSQKLDFFPTFQSSLNTNPFIYGKQNNLYALRAGWGEKRYYSEKGNYKGVALGISYSGGLSLGLLKPYYLDLLRFEDNTGPATISSEPYSEDNELLFLDINRINGASGFSYGWDELRVIPGGYLQAGVHLDWGAFDKFVKGLEIGFMLDVYSKKVPIMVIEDNRFLFMNVYLTLQLGKRW